MDNTEKLIHTTLSNGNISETLEEVVVDYSKRISDAINPVNAINSLAIIYVLEEYARKLRQMYPGAGIGANGLGFIFDILPHVDGTEVDAND